MSFKEFIFMKETSFSSYLPISSEENSKDFKILTSFMILKN